MFHIKSQKLLGASLVEVILAIAIFSLVATAIIGLVSGVFVTQAQAGQQVLAQVYAEEGIEAARAIRRRAWNLLANNSYGLDNSPGYWEWSSAPEMIGDYTRVITVEDVCRDVVGDIADCPAVSIDLQTKKITSQVTWEAITVITNNVTLITYLTNWQSKDWNQSDWSGGSGQLIWSDPSRYWTDDGNIDFSSAGIIRLAGSSGSGTFSREWPFDAPANYSYDTDAIEVVNSFGQLKQQSGTASGQTVNAGFDNYVTTPYDWTFTTPADYIYDPVKIEVASDTARLIASTSIGSVLDTLEFDLAQGSDPDIIHIANDIYAIAYRGPGSDGFVKTVQIDSDGIMPPTTIDSLEFDSSNGYTPSIINVAGNVYAIAYRGTGADGFIKTIGIDSAGNITNSIIDSYEYDTGSGYWPDLIQISSDVFAIAYQGVGNDGFIKTIQIDLVGNITKSVVDSYEYNTSQGSEPDIINVSGDIYAVAHRGAGSDGFISTVSIDSMGNIGTVIDTLEYDTVNGYEPDIIHVSGDVYALAYRGTGSDGFLVTMTIDSLGNVGDTVIDTIEFDPIYGGMPDIINISGDNYALVYRGPNDDGFISILNIQNDGQIADSVVDTLEFDTGSGIYPKIINVGTNIFAIPYQGPGSDGFLKTIEFLAGYDTGLPTIYPNTSFVATGITTWSTFTETAIKNGGEIYYQLSDDDGTTWYWWDGGAWAVAGASDYNTATEVNTNISSFSITNEQIMFMAFLESDGTQEVQLDNVQISSTVFEGWSYYDWDWQGDEVDPSGNVQTTGGNPDEWVDIYFPLGRRDEIGGFWQQSFTTTVGNLDTATLDFDWRVPQYPNSPNSFDIYVFIDSVPGAPVIGTEVHTESISGGTAWATVNLVDVTSSLSTTGTYYLKLATWLETPNQNRGPFQVGFDNAQLSWSKALSGYPDDSPTIQPIASYQPVEITSWTAFSEVANKNGGEIYYQLSDDDGTTWYWWDGGTWVAAVSSTDYNTATEVNNNISEFPVDNLRILFKAFLVGDGTQQVQLDTITIEGENVTLTMEVGQVTTDHQWITVNTLNTYTKPVIVANYYEAANTSAASVRVANVGSNSFDIKLQNPTDSILDQDVISYMVIEEGAWDIGSAIIEAHQYDTSTVAYRGNWIGDSKTYDNTFAVDPIILHQVMSNNDPNWVTTWVSRTGARSSPPDTAGFQIAMNCTEACTSHALPETIGWVAIETNVTDIVEGVAFETQRTPDSVRGHDNGCYTYNFNNAYSGTPIVIPTQLEMDGNDGAWGLMCNLTNTLVGLHSEEDQVGDSERAHATETFGFIAFANSFRVDGSGGASGYANYGEFESSAFNTSSVSSFNLINWSETLPIVNPENYDIQIQIATAPDSGGVPGVWSAWTGIAGAATYYTDPNETLIPLISGHNDDQWVKYKVEFSGDGVDTPILDEININYTP